MKKNKLVICVFVATMVGFSACSNNTEKVLENKTEIRLICEILPSRVTSLNVQSTQIVEGQQVGVTILGGNKEHNNVAWCAENNGSLTPTDVVYWTENQTSIIAYHPFNANWTGTVHEFSVSTDQSKDKDYLNSDLLWTKATASVKDVPISLLFSHKLAKINITLISDDLVNLGDATIYICGTQISTKFNPSTGDLSASTMNVADIKAGITTDLAYTSSAIIIPQEIASGTEFIRISHRDKEYTYQLPESIKFESGHSYNYTLNIKSNDVYQATGNDFESEWC